MLPVVMFAGFAVHTAQAQIDQDDCSIYASADPAVLSPGQESEFAGKIKGLLKQGRNVISFGGYIDEGGKLSVSAVAISTTSSRNRVNLIQKEVNRLKFKPSTLNGDHLLVYATYMAIVDVRPDDSIAIVMFNNHGPLFPDFNADDTSPQRVGIFGGKDMLFNGAALAGTVGVDGRIRDIDTLKQTDMTMSDMQYLEKRLTRFCYVPGRRDGSPHEMTFYEVFERRP